VYCWCRVAENVLHHTYPLEYIKSAPASPGRSSVEPALYIFSLSACSLLAPTPLCLTCYCTVYTVHTLITVSTSGTLASNWPNMYIKQKIQRRHLFADLRIPHLRATTIEPLQENSLLFLKRILTKSTHCHTNLTLIRMAVKKVRSLLDGDT
jgi:hypothetical protein